MVIRALATQQTEIDRLCGLIKDACERIEGTVASFGLRCKEEGGHTHRCPACLCEFRPCYCGTPDALVVCVECELASEQGEEAKREGYYGGKL